jgi:hypothetical protein
VPSRVDAIGYVITDMKTNAAAVLALLPNAKRIQGNEKRTVSPCVVVGVGVDRPSISAYRGHVRDLTLNFRCYAPKSPTGDIEARSLALAVGDYLDLRGPRVSAGGVGIYISLESNTSGVIIDPDSGEPMVLVVVGFKTAAYPVA